MNNKVDKLLSFLLEQAVVLLRDSEEFYPFGGVIDEHDSLTSLSAYTGEEYPESTSLIELLEAGIYDKFLKEKIYHAAIAFDINFREKTNDAPISAIQIRLFINRNLCENHYYPYKIENNEINIISHKIYTV